MIFRRGAFGAVVLLATLLATATEASPSSKSVHLRSGVIRTGPRPSNPDSKTFPTNRNESLVLIQFESALQPEWRTQLRSLGVELLQYVPDDAFVARLRGTSPADVCGLPFVRWLDEYRPAQRIQRSLSNNPRLLQGDDREITMLIASDARPEDLAGLKGRFRNLARQENHRFGAVLQGRFPISQLLEAAASPAVLWIEPSASAKLADESSSAIVGGPATNHITFSQALGYNGAGVVVAVADTGLDNGTFTSPTELLGNVKALLSYGGLTTPVDEHGHGTHVAGIIAGRGLTQEGDDFGFYGLGVAPRSQVVIQRIFDRKGDFRAPPLETLTHDAVRLGAVIGNNSWTEDTQGRYDLNAAQFDALVRDADAGTPGDQPYLLVFAAGNAGPGPQTIGSPAVGKNVLAVGASQGPRTNFFTHNDGVNALASFSSRGPCEDGRIKPDLLAPGTWIASLLSSSGRVENILAPINNEFAFMGGTSQSSPHVAGAAAVFVQYYRFNYGGETPSPALTKAALINAATDLTGEGLGAPAPNMDEGWGRADVARLVKPDRSFAFVDQTTRLAVGQVYEQPIFINRTNLPLKVTLAYTDYPGFPAAVPALVNDLDLELVGPDGRTYRGNQFDHGESSPGANTRDALNNVEGILLNHPLGGEYTVRVRAQSVSQDSCLQTANITDQDFALVISGGTPARGEGVVLADRSAYRAPGIINVRLLDSDLIGQPSATITARSRTETNGQVMTLLAAGFGGGFTGSIATAIGPASNDGKLQIADGDWIRLEYFDASVARIQSAMATADLTPPVTSDVIVTNAIGQLFVAWTTDEPATSVVRFGTTDTALNRLATNNALTTVHAIELGGLLPGQVYYFEVVSIDAAGNATTSRNGNVPYSFTAGVTPTVLLVDAYEADPQDSPIPLSSYTVPLTEIGVNFDVWSLTALNSLPELETLRRYPVVIWRVNDSIHRPNDSIPPAQQTIIQQYLDAGGSFFIASMNIVSRLLNQNSSGFVTNVLHVQRFTLSPNPFEHCANCDEDFRVPVALGVASDPIGQGLHLDLDYTGYPMDGLRGPDFSDTFTPVTNASPFIVEAVTGKACGMRFPRTGEDSPGRIVFASFPLDAIPLSAATPNNRTDFLRRVIQFLAPGVGGVGTLALDQDVYSLPDLITVEMADSDLEGQVSAIVKIHSDSQPNPIFVALAETTRPGLFRGSIPVTEGPGPGTLSAAPNDVIHVVYEDQSVGATAQTTATIDADRPGINDLTVQAGFATAVITWTTTEPTDALIQFGESAFLGRTEYRAERQTSHSLRLIALVPGRTYYFKISVRDAAGNLTFSDNAGELHTFTTRPPLLPTFFDDIENPDTGTNWTILSSDDSQREWSTGPPNDGHTAMAYSGLNVWASNLYGEPADVIDTYLISPGIDLRGANVAELRFQQDYDFTDRTGFDFISEGRLLISTNVQTDPIPIVTYHDFIFDWEEEVVDLTPYAGRVVFLIWHHQVRSTSPEPPVERPGWAIDDVRITASNVPSGNIRVTSNISQARYSVRRGALVQSGQGSSFTFTNLPPGTYRVEFENVPYYDKPAPRTNQLSSSIQVTVTGNYTFSDINTNGMSDAWELAQFGNVSLNRNRFVDTDADGFTDYAEFVAGTNPQLLNSHLFLAPPLPLSATLVRFSWPSVPGRSYQLQGSDGSGFWIPLSSWLRAGSDVTSVIMPPPGPADPYLYRIEVLP